MGANNKRLTNEEFQQRLRAVHPQITVTSAYARSHGFMDAECRDCGNKWAPKAYSLLQGHGCPVCTGGGKTWTQEQYISRLNKAHKGRLFPIDAYIDSGTSIKHGCDKGHTWKARPRDVIRSVTACPDCVRVRLIAGCYAEQTKSEFTDRARALTRAVYKRFAGLVNPANHKQGRKDFVVDHMYSIAECFYNPKNLKRPIRLEELCHPANLQMLPYKDNLSKQTKCAVTASELRAAIVAWNKKHGRPFSLYNERLTFNA